MEGNTNPEVLVENGEERVDGFMPDVSLQKAEFGLFDEAETQLNGEETDAAPEEDEDTLTQGSFFSQPDDTIRVKYNGETLRLTQEQAAVMAQKGMNYDKVSAERDRLRQGVDVRRIDELARAEGMNRDAYLNKLVQESRERRLAKAAEQVKKRFPGIPEGAAQELAEAKALMARQAKEKTNTPLQQDTEALSQEEHAKASSPDHGHGDGTGGEDTVLPQEQWDEGYWARDIAPWHAFLQRYPEMKSIERIPTAVLADVERGVSPLEAMLSHELEEANAEIEQLRDALENGKREKKNRKKAMNTLESSGEALETDLFLQGLGF